MDQPEHRAIILTALPVEYEAVRAFLRDIHEDEDAAGTVYEVGTFFSEPVPWSVCIAEVGAGNTNVASYVERAVAYFRPKVAFFVGVAGGIKDVSIGDVVVATKVYGYESGKEYEDGFRPRPELGSSAFRLVQRARAEAKKQNSSSTETEYAASQVQPRVFVGPIAAGEKVLAARQGEISKFIRHYYGDALAVEMEGRGFIQSFHAHPTIDAVVIRGISDLLSDKEESDEAGCQRLASEHAAGFAFKLLGRLNKYPGSESSQIQHLEDRGDCQPPATARALAPQVETKPSQPLPELKSQINTIKGRIGTSQLFGVNKQRQHICKSLADSQSRAVISIVGIGGIGKTALAASALCETLEGPQPPLHAWFSARQEEFDYFGSRLTNKNLSLELESLITDVASQLKLTEIVRSTGNDRLSQLIGKLSENPSIIVIDNIETNRELQALAPLLAQAERAFPTRFLVTSRSPCHPIPTNSIPLDELREDDALALLQFEATRRNIDSVISVNKSQLRPLFDLVGGNPLALNLALGLLDRLPLSRVIKDLSTGRRRESENLYAWIYNESWRLLSRSAKFLLILISRLSAEGVSWERLSSISQLAPDTLDDAVRELVNLSLIRQVGDLTSRSYSAHRLTIQFCNDPGTRQLDQDDSDYIQSHLTRALTANAKYSLELLKSLEPEGD